MLLRLRKTMIRLSPLKPDQRAVFNTKGKFASSGEVIHYDYHVPIKFDEKTDIEIKAENQAASGDISALFDLIILDN